MNLGKGHLDEGLERVWGLAKRSQDIKREDVCCSLPDRKDLSVSQDARNAAVLHVSHSSKAFEEFTRSLDAEFAGKQLDERDQQSQHLCLSFCECSCLFLSLQEERIVNQMQRSYFTFIQSFIHTFIHLISEFDAKRSRERSREREGEYHQVRIGSETW